MATAMQHATGSNAAAADDVEMVEASELRRRNRPRGDGGAVAAAEEDEDEAASVERAFADQRVPSWREQLTVRAFVASFFLATMFSVIVMKLNLTVGIIPSLNVSAGLLSFFFVRLWTAAMEKVGLLRQPFTRQENTVIQTCVVAAYGISFSGGFGNYLLAMSDRIASQADEANNPQNIKNPHLGWIIGFLLLVSFIGLFGLVPLRKEASKETGLVLRAQLLLGFLSVVLHSHRYLWIQPIPIIRAASLPEQPIVHKVIVLFMSSGAWTLRFYFDFSPTYVGVGMICPHIVNVSVLLGGILSWGIMWSLIAKKRGIWFSADLADTSLHGMQGYRVFIAIALILGDGLYNFLKMLILTAWSLRSQHKKSSASTLPISDDEQSNGTAAISYDEERRNELFLKDQIPWYIAYGGYAAVAAVSIGTVPQIFPQLKWYQILVAYIVAPILAFCNAYGTGLTDWSLVTTYGKLAIFAFGAWTGASHGGVLAGLAACGVMMSIVSTAADLMQDFKTGYLTLASPRSMFISQVIGTAMGCVIAPCVFWLFYKAFDNIGISGSEYPAPNAAIFRSMAILGVDGFSSLPKNCLTLCYIFFVGAIVVNLIRDLVPKKVSNFIPIPMAMAIPFYIGSYFAIDMFIGTVILFVWQKLDRAKSETFAPAVASGLICGDGLWVLPQSVLALAKVKPPICMKFLSRGMNDKVDAFITTLS
ncbi:probable metal-nicotianamine transporter YSL13 isoform X2 [Aegilops tauschii subsp. strangulata]|uniref:probable metal-nicotianamine transporter YSL13 isoform X2 n=1 Tax=Aegilops tauschii subsp. strangulata TaxID=200361 RepID=UPI00098B3511|nr:probable metal-nicotianamine transporter YSL13 isoform X2 [Aegilops tauschii subsp. strangulata]